MDFKVGLKYCGHCQPHMPMTEFARDLAKLTPGLSYTRWDDFGNYQALLVLNACTAQCASVPEVDVPKVIVSSHTLDYSEYRSREELLEATAQTLRGLAGDNKKIDPTHN